MRKEKLAKSGSKVFIVCLHKQRHFRGVFLRVYKILKNMWGWEHQKRLVSVERLERNAQCAKANRPNRFGLIKQFPSSL
ncbi:hypothetical protein ACOSQ3_013528 [Xanthoceras sorbifolium]